MEILQAGDVPAVSGMAAGRVESLLNGNCDPSLLSYIFFGEVTHDGRVTRDDKVTCDGRVTGDG